MLVSRIEKAERRRDEVADLIMSYLRINCTLQQFDEFLDCYGITEGDNMYLAPADRVAIW